MSVIYKIKRRSDGLFSSGGSGRRFSKHGKAWSNMAHVKRHLADMGDRNFAQNYADCDIVEFTESQPISIFAVRAEAMNRRLELQRQKEERRERWRAERLRRLENT